MPDDHDIKIRPEDIHALNIDDTLEIVLEKYPLKFMLKALVRKHGLASVGNALTELNRSASES